MRRTKNSGVEKRNVGNRLKLILAKFCVDSSHVRGVTKKIHRSSFEFCPLLYLFRICFQNMKIWVFWGGNRDFGNRFSGARNSNQITRFFGREEKSGLNFSAFEKPRSLLQTSFCSEMAKTKNRKPKTEG